MGASRHLPQGNNASRHMVNAHDDPVYYFKLQETLLEKFKDVLKRTFDKHWHGLFQLGELFVIFLRPRHNDRLRHRSEEWVHGRSRTPRCHQPAFIQVIDQSPSPRDLR